MEQEEAKSSTLKSAIVEEKLSMNAVDICLHELVKELGPKQ